MKMKLNFSHALALASALGLWVARAHAQYDVIVTPDQFHAQDPWTDLYRTNVGAYQGDTAAGYYWTPNFSSSPSGTIVVPLPAGMPSGWHQYAVCQWVPNVHSQEWATVVIAADGTVTNDYHAGEPWVGQSGTNLQWLGIRQADQGGWVQLGPGPQSDQFGDGGPSNPNMNGGYGVYMSPDTGKGYPYLYIKYNGFEVTPQSFDALHVVQIDGPTWNSDLNGNSPLPWSDPGNWSTGVPNAQGAVANFLHVSTAPGTVTVDQPVIVGLMNFSNTNGYTLAGSGSDNTITMNNSGSNSLIEVLQGSHAIGAPMVLDGNGAVDLSLCMAGTFTISGNISEAAAGTGVLTLDADSTGTLVLSGTNTYSSTQVLAGTLIVQHPYSLLDGSSLTVGDAAAFLAPVVAGGQAMAPVPEPGTLALLAAGGAAVLLLVRRKRRA